MGRILPLPGVAQRIDARGRVQLTDAQQVALHRRYPTEEDRLCVRFESRRGGEFLGLGDPCYYVTNPPELYEMFPDRFDVTQRLFHKDRDRALHYIEHDLIPALRLRPGASLPDHTISEFVASYLIDYAETPQDTGRRAGKLRARSTGTACKTALKKLVETRRRDGTQLGDLEPQQLTRADLRSYRQVMVEEDQSELYQMNCYSSVRCFLRWLQLERHVGREWVSPLPDAFGAVAPTIEDLAPIPGMRLCNVAQAALVYGVHPQTILRWANHPSTRRDIDGPDLS
jgi:hypothetical protein